MNFTVGQMFLTSVLCSQEPVSPEPGAAVRCLHAAEAHLPGDGVHGAGLPAQLSASAPRKSGIAGPAGNLPRRQPGHAASGAERLHPQRPGQKTSTFDQKHRKNRRVGYRLNLINSDSSVVYIFF